jgi:predicted phosphodiesterase
MLGRADHRGVGGSNMARITWLHLSDWHQKVPPDAARNPVRERLLTDIRDRGRNISPVLEEIDFIVFTGDIAHQAQTTEYGAAMHQFIRPIIEAAGVDYDHQNNKTIFLVPGNHDMDRSKIGAVDACYHIDFQGPDAVSQANTYLGDHVIRDKILKPFSAYSDFVFTYFRGDERDQDKQAAYFYVKLLHLAEKAVAIVGLNSAIFSGRNIVTSPNGQPRVHDYGYLALTETQIDDAFRDREVRDAHIKIALMHHPFSWLVEEDRVSVQDALSKHCHFILHGHEHMRRVEVTNSTLGNHVVIPAGSSYDRRHPGNPRYTNGYNFVSLNLDTNQATVYLRSWHEQGRTWDADTDSAPQGRVDFSIQELLDLHPPSSQSPSIMSGCSLQESHWHKPGNVYYVAHDIYWTIDYLKHNYPKGRILYALNQTIYHLRELGGKESRDQENELILVKEQLTKLSEDELRCSKEKSECIDRLIITRGQLGVLAALKQPDFRGGPE